jgi:hypothetical protein
MCVCVCVCACVCVRRGGHEVSHWLEGRGTGPEDSASGFFGLTHWHLCKRGEGTHQGGERPLLPSPHANPLAPWPYLMVTASTGSPTTEVMAWLHAILKPRDSVWSMPVKSARLITILPSAMIVLGEASSSLASPPSAWKSARVRSFSLNGPNSLRVSTCKQEGHEANVLH